MVKAVTFGPKHHFFGFHDLCPWDISGRYILAMETDFISRLPTAEDKAKICLIDLEHNNKLETLAETSAWNFHQGARLQWLPGRENKIIYNDYDYDNKKFISVVLDIKTGEKKLFPFPIYAINPRGDFGLGLNFIRLQKYGGYGYMSRITNDELQIADINEPFPKDDGIFQIDFKTGEVKLIISLHDVAHLNNFPRENDHHILTHIAFNPSGSRVCFIDKYRLPDGGFLQRLIATNSDGNDIYVLPGHITHYTWRNDAEILGYGKFSPKVMVLRKVGFSRNILLKQVLNIVRMMRGILKQRIAGQSYLLLKDKTQEVKRIAVGIMTEDGHPQFSPNRKLLITDTYSTVKKSDEQLYRTLILYNWEKHKKFWEKDFGAVPTESEELKEKFKNNIGAWDLSEMRCDLHPRWNRDSTKICFDSVDKIGRQMYVVDVKDIITISKNNE